MYYLIYFLITFFLTESPALAGGACAHRGDHISAPENTVPAIVSAVKKGAHQIEIDVQLSKDGKLVIMHDDSVDRTTNGTGKVADLTFQELRKLDAGSWFAPRFKGTKIPTLREALEVIPHEILCNVHVKGGPETSVPVAKLIAEMDRLDYCFFSIGGSEAHKAMAAARAAVPDIMICTGFLIDKETITQETNKINKTEWERYRKLYPENTINRHIDIIQLVYWGTPIPKDSIEDSVRILRKRGVKTNFCCASTEEPVRQLIEAGVDYILTDDLDLCLKILAEYGIKPVNTSNTR